VAEAGDRDAGEEVEVLVAVDVDQRAAVAARDRQLGELRDALETGGNVRLLGAMHGPRTRARQRSGLRCRARSGLHLALVCAVRYEAIASEAPERQGA